MTYTKNEINNVVTQLDTVLLKLSQINNSLEFIGNMDAVPENQGYGLLSFVRVVHGSLSELDISLANMQLEIQRLYIE